MKAIKIVTPVLVLLLALFAWLAPIGPLPGIVIGGDASDVPDTWGDTSSTHEIRLKVTGSSLPRVVTIWVIQVDGHLYIVGSKTSGWVSMLGQGGPVEMRMGDETYALNASIITTNWQPILTAYQDKYRPDYPDIVNGLPGIDQAAGTISVFRLTAS
jgi:hypothetical protein